LLLIEIFFAYQLISYLFNKDIYIKEINNKEIKIEYNIMGLAAIGLLQIICIIMYNLYNKTFLLDSNIIKGLLILFISASIGINIYLIILAKEIYHGEKAIKDISDNKTKTYNDIQILIPSSIGLYIIIFGICFLFKQT